MSELTPFELAKAKRLPRVAALFEAELSGSVYDLSRPLADVIKNGVRLAETPIDPAVLAVEYIEDSQAA